MKFIGQFIQDLIARFRNDVYLEGTETGTIASGGNLGLDSNNKIVKAASGSGDLTITNASDNRIVTSTGGTGLNAEANFTYNGANVEIASTGNGPNFNLRTSSTTAAHNPSLNFVSDDTTGSDGDELGLIQFNGYNDSGGVLSYANIEGSISSATAGSEGGKLTISVASHDGDLEEGLVIQDGDADGEVDVTIGAGAASTTTVSGSLAVGTTVITDDQIQFTPSTDDTATIAAGAGGVLNITTVDDAGRNAELNITADGIISTTSSASQINTTYDFQSTTFENLLTAGKPSGKIIKYSPATNATLTAGQVHYLRDTGSWLLADADGVSTSYGLLGLGMGGSSQTVGVMIQGFMRIPSAEILNTPTNVDGLPVYLGTEAGHFDFTAPSGSGDIVRVLGYAIDDHLGDVLIYFNPDRTFIEIA
tara:strand:- start:1865 stop:3127 length:1263 start_codon:yes stop_codon:yes gene_type:complete